METAALCKMTYNQTTLTVGQLIYKKSIKSLLFISGDISATRLLNNDQKSERKPKNMHSDMCEHHTNAVNFIKDKEIPNKISVDCIVMREFLSSYPATFHQ